MRALIYESYGGPEKLSVRDDLPEPPPAAGAIRIHTRTTGLNPVDTLQREGTFRAFDPHQFPKIGGNELSGVVESAGPGTSRRTPGRIRRSRFCRRNSCRSSPDNRAAGGYCRAFSRWGAPAQQEFAPDHLDLQPTDRLLITGRSADSHLRSCRVRRMAKRAGTHFEFFLMHPDGAGLAELVSLIDDGKRILPIDSRYPLHQCKDAFKRLESRRSKDKVMLEF